LKFKINDSRIAGHRLDVIKGKDVGNTSFVVSDGAGNVIHVPICVIPAGRDYITDWGLPIFMLNEDRDTYYQRGIYSCHALLDSLDKSVKVIDDVQTFSSDFTQYAQSQIDWNANNNYQQYPDRINYGIEETRERLYARESALYELPYMDRNFALIAAFAGIRNIHDLARVNKTKALSVFKIVSPMARMFEDDDDDFVYPCEEEICSIIDRAHVVTDFSSKYAKFVYHDPEPTYLLDYGVKKVKTDTEVIYEALQFIQNMSISLPLPRTISGTVVMRKEKESLEDAVPQRGYKVTVTGIANPASDKSEDEEDIHTFTDNDGKFIIVMPEKYNMQETVKFTVSHDTSKDKVSSMTSEESLKSLKTTTFVKRASEIMKAIRIEYYTWIPDALPEENDELDKDRDLIASGHWDYKSIPAIELLEKLDRLKEANRHAKELEEELYARALNEYDKEQLEKQIGDLKVLSASNFHVIFDELSYHVYEKENELEEVKELRNRLIFHFDKDLKDYLSKQQKTIEKKIDALIKKRDALENHPVDGSELKIKEIEVSKLELVHQVDVIKTLKVTCKKEDDRLFRYILDNTFDYNLRDEIAENSTSVRREELVEYFENDKVWAPKLESFLADFQKYTAQMDSLSDLIKLLKNLLDFAKGITCYEVKEDDSIKADADGKEDEELSDVTSHEKKENISETDQKKEGGINPLQLVDDEHHLGVTVLDEKAYFETALEQLYNGSLEECNIFCRKYEAFKDVEKQLYLKQQELDRLSEVKEEISREDIFAQYCKDNKEDKRVKAYREYNSRANELYREIQDMDDTIGIKFISEFENSERDKEAYKERSNSSSLQAVINSILGKSLDACFEDPFELIAENFIGVDSKPRALPTVRLMGEGKEEVELPTDTAPARVFNYSIMQRLVEPSITKDGIDYERDKLIAPIDVMDFKESLYNIDEKVPLASSLGIGYILNMHQAWIPDGYALGNLLYSMILAPGEEQRVIVREHTENYLVSDDASALDMIRDEYANNQIDHETAAFEQAVLRASDATSEAHFSTQSTSVSASVSGGWGPIGGSISASHSRSSGRSGASAAQNDSYDEISTAAQDFQTSIKTQSERLASAKRLSIRTASSSETESISSKIVANHNHSHVMTVQYWEVSRRYKMETSIEGIDLVLFVPLKPVCFLPGHNGDEEKKIANSENFSGATLSIKEFSDFTKELFEYRYHSFLRYGDILERYLPKKYRGGLELMKKFAACPKWIPQQEVSDKSVVQLKLVGYFLEYDDITATMHFNKSKDTVIGELEVSDYLSVHPSMNTRKDVIYAMKKLRNGFNVMKDVDQIRKVGGWTFRSSMDEYITTKVEEVPVMIFTFYLPSYLSKDDVSNITIENNLSSYSFSLSQNREFLQNHEIDAIENYEHQKWNFAKDDRKSGNDLRRMAHYKEALPECYTDQLQTFSRSDLISIGGTKIAAYVTEGQGFTDAILQTALEKTDADGSEKDNKEEKPDEESAEITALQMKIKESSDKVPTSSNKLLANTIRIDISSHVPVLGYEEITQMEETFRHVTANTIRYSLAVWNSMNEIERTMMLEQYTVDLNYGKLTGKLGGQDEKVRIPLLNCINVKKPLGYYGNSIMFPFTYPAELAEKIGKTAGDIQDELYRYHTTNFRVPSTSISVPTNGMIGEAVLGRTNVSEKVDITRFWNWKDSDIDHIEINQNGLNGHSLLDNADTKWVDAPTQGVAATDHVSGSGLLNSLTSRAQPTFADVLANTDVRGLLQNADNNASAGREQAMKATSDMTKSAISAASDIAKSLASKTSAVSNIVGDKGNITTALKKMGLSDSVASQLSDKIASGDSSFSDVLTSISNAGGKSLGGLSDSGLTGSSENSETKDPESKTDSQENSLDDIINFAMEALESGLTPVEMFNKWVKEKKNSDRTYTEEEIRKIAEHNCEKNGTTMDAVIVAINELIGQ